MTKKLVSIQYPTIISLCREMFIEFTDPPNDLSLNPRKKKKKKLTKIKERILQVTFHFLLYALLHVIWAVALVPIKH